MAVFTAQSAQKFVQTVNGKRVLFLAAGDHLTPSARDWLQTEEIEIRVKPSDKPEHMTHLRAGELVPKTHPVIDFRGMLDLLQSELLLCGNQAQGWVKGQLEELLDVTRQIMRCQVLGEPWQEQQICGLSAEELRSRSHDPQAYYGQGHFMPSFEDDRMLLRLNRLRTLIRRTELAACRGIPERADLIRVLNRLSSLLWIMMIRLKKEASHGTEP